MVCGYPPFYSDTPQKTCQKILNWKKHFAFPKEPRTSSACQDLIRKLIAEPHERLQDATAIKRHPFFTGVDFDRIRTMRPPFTPDKKELTSNFEKFEEGEPWYTNAKDIDKAADVRGRQQQWF